MRDRRRRMYMLRSSGTARMASIRKLKVLSGPVGVGPAQPRCMVYNTHLAVTLQLLASIVQFDR